MEIPGSSEWTAAQYRSYFKEYARVIPLDQGFELITHALDRHRGDPVRERRLHSLYGAFVVACLERVLYGGPIHDDFKLMDPMELFQVGLEAVDCISVAEFYEVMARRPEITELEGDDPDNNWYDIIFSPQHEARLAAFSTFLGDYVAQNRLNVRKLKAADLGGGTGNSTRVLTEAQISVNRICIYDNSDALLQIASAKFPGIKTSQKDLFQAGILANEKTVDIVIAHAFAHYCPEGLQREYYQNVFDLLSLGGVYFESSRIHQTELVCYQTSKTAVMTGEIAGFAAVLRDRDARFTPINQKMLDITSFTPDNADYTIRIKPVFQSEDANLHIVAVHKDRIKRKRRRGGRKGR